MVAVSAHGATLLGRHDKMMGMAVQGAMGAPTLLGRQDKMAAMGMPWVGVCQETSSEDTCNTSKCGGAAPGISTRAALREKGLAVLQSINQVGEGATKRGSLMGRGRPPRPQRSAGRVPSQRLAEHLVDTGCTGTHDEMGWDVDTPGVDVHPALHDQQVAADFEPWWVRVDGDDAPASLRAVVAGEGEPAILRLCGSDDDIHAPALYSRLSF